MAQQTAAAVPAAPGTAPAAVTAPRAPTDAQALAATRKQFESLTATFKALSSAAVPLSQEIVTLEQTVLEQQVALATLTGAGLPAIDTLPDTAA